MSKKVHPARRMMRRIGPFMVRFARSPLNQLIGCRLAVLTTQGRKTARPHRVPVTCAPDGDVVYLFRFGRQPADWLANIRANPEVKIWAQGRELQGLAQVLPEGEEKQRAAYIWMRRFRPLAALGFGEWRLNADSASRVAETHTFIAVQLQNHTRV